MTYKQLHKLSNIFSQMQELRGEFLNEATKTVPVDHALLEAAQIFEKGKESMKEKFLELTNKYKFD